MDEIDHQIIEACQTGNAAAFAQVVLRYERPLLAYVYRLGCTPPSRGPEDVVQEVFVKAYKNIRLYKGRDGGSFSTWLFSIARNHCVSLMRRRQLEDRAIRPMDDTEVQADPAHGPAEILSRRETARQVADAVAALPETQRSVFVLRYYEDLSYEAIARIVECNVGTIRSRLARAKKAIQEQLQAAGVDRRES